MSGEEGENNPALSAAQTDEGKVEKILKSSLDWIQSPTPSMKIQIIDGKVCLRCKGKTLLSIVNKLFVFKSLLSSTSNISPYYRK